MHYSIETIQQQVRTLIEQNKLTEAIATLAECSRNEKLLQELQNPISLLSSQLVDLKSKISAQIIDEKDANLQFRKIIHSLLEIVQGLDHLVPENLTIELPESVNFLLKPANSPQYPTHKRPSKRKFWPWLIGGLVTLIAIISGIFQIIGITMISLIGCEPQTEANPSTVDSTQQVIQEVPEDFSSRKKGSPTVNPSNPEKENPVEHSEMVAGRVQNENGQPVSQVRVRVFAEEGDVDLTLITDDTGNFKGKIPLPKNTWIKLQINVDGYQSETRSHKLPETNILIQLNKIQ